MNRKAEEGEFKNILIGFILFALFGALILTAVQQTGTTYDKDMTEVGGGALAVVKFNSSFSGIENSAKVFKEKFDNGNVWSAVAGVVVDGVFGIARDMTLLIWTPFNLLSNVMQDVLDIPATVVSVILAILIFSIMFAVWQLIKIGN